MSLSRNLLISIIIGAICGVLIVYTQMAATKFTIDYAEAIVELVGRDGYYITLFYVVGSIAIAIVGLIGGGLIAYMISERPLLMFGIGGASAVVANLVIAINNIPKIEPYIIVHYLVLFFSVSICAYFVHRKITK